MKNIFIITVKNRFSYNTYAFAGIKPYDSSAGRARVLFMYGENGLHYAFSQHLSFTNAYVFERKAPFEHNARNEHRLFQPLTRTIPVNKNVIKRRWRFDQRFIQNNISGNFDFTHRLWYSCGWNHAFNKKWYLTAYTEFFFNTTINAKFKWNENWSALQAGYRVSAHNAIEFGYLFAGWMYNSDNLWFNQHDLQTTRVNKLYFNNL